MHNKTTIYTLAKELNVSTSAVSRAFNEKSYLSQEKRVYILEEARKRGYVPNRAAARLSQSTITIGTVIVNRIPDFYQSVFEGVESAANDLASEKVRADIRIIKATDNVTGDVMEVLDDFMERKCDGIIVHGIYSPDIVTKVNQIVEAGIPVATLHNDLPGSKRLFSSTSNTEMTGAIAAELLNFMLPPGNARVAIFTGSMSSPIHQGLRASFERHCSMYSMSIVGAYDTKDSPDIAREYAREAVASNPTLGGIYVSSANSVPICEYLQSNGLAGSIKVITSDVFPRLSAYIRAGVVSATIYQDPHHQGRNALELLYYHLANGMVVPEIVLSNPQIVLSSNLALFEKQTSARAPA